MGLNRAIRDQLAEMDIADPLTRKININMSGCPNGCGQHHIANIGFYGASIKIGDKTMPAYVAHIGGHYENGEGVAFGRDSRCGCPPSASPTSSSRACASTRRSGATARRSTRSPSASG